MKKNIMIIAVTILITIGLIFAGRYQQTYVKKDCMVMEKNGNLLTIEDNDGYLWDVEAEGFKVGDIVKLKFTNNNTDNTIMDDEVIDIILK